MPAPTASKGSAPVEYISSVGAAHLGMTNDNLLIEPSTNPENPALLLLIRCDLSGKPLPVEVLVRVWRPVRVPLHVIRNAQTPFSNDGRGVAVQLVAAGCADVAVLGDGDAGPLQIPVVVVGGVVGVSQSLGGITRAPESVHHLDVQVVVFIDVEALLCSADSLRSRLEHCPCACMELPTLKALG